jgi:hypothetical protein
VGYIRQIYKHVPPNTVILRLRYVALLWAIPSPHAILIVGSDGNSIIPLVRQPTSQEDCHFKFQKLGKVKVKILSNNHKDLPNLILNKVDVCHLNISPLHPLFIEHEHMQLVTVEWYIQLVPIAICLFIHGARIHVY